MIEIHFETYVINITVIISIFDVKFSCLHKLLEAG